MNGNAMQDAIGFDGLAWGYLLLIFPLAIMLWYRVPLVGQTLLAVVRTAATGSRRLHRA